MSWAATAKPLGHDSSGRGMGQLHGIRYNRGRVGGFRLKALALKGDDCVAPLSVLFIMGLQRVAMKVGRARRRLSCELEIGKQGRENSEKWSRFSFNANFTSFSPKVNPMSDEITDQELVSKFASRWKTGSEWLVEDFCASLAVDHSGDSAAGSTTGEVSRALLIGLVQTEIRARLERGQSVELLELIDRFPNLDSDILRDLVTSPVVSASGSEASMLPSRYQRISKLGQGGVAEVWKAWDDLMQREVAIKTIRAELRSIPSVNKRLEREALITGNIQHPGIPAIHSYGRLADGSVHVVMKQVEGRTLAEILGERPKEDRDLTPLLNIFEQIAQTVAFAHSLRCIHRDLKPQNVMVGRFGEVQVMDWGMAKRLDEEEPADEANELQEPAVNSSVSLRAEASLTRAGEVFGTPAYMPPEQARGERELVGTEADVFALGAILFELLTGDRLYEHASEESMLSQAIAGNTASQLKKLDDPSVAPQLRAICSHCLQADASQRPKDAGQVAESITSCIEGTQKSLEQARLKQHAAEVQAAEERKRRKAAWVWSTGIISASLLGIFGVAWQWSLASAARDEASSQKLLAESRFLEAKKTVDDYLAEVAGSGSLLSATPGTQTLRRQQLTKAKDYYVAFTETKPESEEIKAQLAAAYQSLGIISRELESNSETVEVLAQSIAIRDELIDADYDRQVNLLEKLTTLNELAIAYDRIGELPATIEACEAIKRIVNSGTLRPSLQVDLAYAKSLSTLGTVLSRMGDDAAAEAVQVESVDFLAKLYGDEKNRAVVLMTYAEALRRLAVTETEYARLDAAREHLELALELMDASDEKDLERAYNSKESVVYAATANALAQVYWDASESVKAIATMKQCCLQLEAIVAANPLVAQPIQILGNCYNGLAYYLTATSNDEALQIFERSLPLLTKAAADRPQDVVMLKELAEAHAMRGEYLLQQGESAAALEDNDQALAINQRRRQLAPENRDAIDLVIEGYKSRGILLRRLGRTDEGAEAYMNGIALIEELESTGRASRETLVSKAGIYNNLAFLYTFTSQIEASLEPYEAAVKLYGELAEGDVVRQEYYYQASSLTNLGNSLGQLGRTAEALEQFARSVDMLESAMEKRPDNRMLLQYLFESYVYRSEMFDKSREYTKAKSDLEKALALPLEKNPFVDLSRLRLLAINVSLGSIQPSVEKAVELVQGKSSDFYLEAAIVAARAAVHFLEDETQPAVEREEAVKRYATLAASLIVEAMEKNKFMHLKPSIVPTLSSNKRLWDRAEYAAVREFFK